MFASINVLRAQFFPSIFRPPVFDPRNQDLSVEFFHGAVSCAARLVTCKPPICVRGACHHSAPPKARVDQGQSGTSQNRSRRRQAVGLSGQAPSIAPALAASAACAFIWDAELKSLKVWPPKAARSAEAQDFQAAQERLLLSSLLSLFLAGVKPRVHHVVVAHGTCAGSRQSYRCAGLTRSVAKTDRAMEAWYHSSIA